VTGSYLPLSADAPAIPVTTIDAQTIENSGESVNLQEVLTKVGRSSREVSTSADERQRCRKFDKRRFAGRDPQFFDPGC